MTAISPMLSHIVHGLIVEETGIELVAEKLDRPGDLEAAIRRLQPDVVMMGFDGPDDWANEFLLAHPRVRLITLSSDGRVARLQALVPKRIVMADVSPEMLLNAIVSEVPPDASQDEAERD